MPEQPNVSPVRGMRDLLPAECELRDWAVGRILDVYRRFGFARIETPVLEHLALLTGGQGGENEKLIFKVLSRGETLEQEWVEALLRFDLAHQRPDAAAVKNYVDVLSQHIHSQAASPLTVNLRRYFEALLKQYEAGQRGPPEHAPREAKDLKTVYDSFVDYARWAIAALPRSIVAGDQFSESGLRFDLTVPLARYYASNQSSLSHPFKAIQIGPVFRAERPQKGRFRQFTQCDIDVLGEAGEIAEVELILATTEALAALGLSGFTVRVNDRRIHEAFLEQYELSPDSRASVFIAIDKLDKVGWSKVADELKALGCPDQLIDNLQRRLAPVVDSGSAVGGPVEHYVRLFEEMARHSAPDHPIRSAVTHVISLQQIAATVAGLTAGIGARVIFDPTLVRGMGYYTGPIFEISMEGAPGSIAGGGRYDRMIGRMLGREVPACGFSIGFERVIGLLMERGVRAPKAATRFALLYEPGTDSLARVMAEAAARRGAVDGNSVAVFARRKKLGKQLDELEKAGFDCVLTLPEGNGPPEEKWLGSATDR